MTLWTLLSENSPVGSSLIMQSCHEFEWRTRGNLSRGINANDCFVVSYLDCFAARADCDFALDFNDVLAGRLGILRKFGLVLDSDNSAAAPPVVPPLSEAKPSATCVHTAPGSVLGGSETMSGRHCENHWDK